MTLKEIAEREGSTISAVNMVINRALRKLRVQGLLVTCRELAEHLDRNRMTAHTVSRTARRR
jgi:DNA-binding CsgD family transcriptional regulator